MTGTTSPKLCFVIMPFSKERKEVYKFGIAPACQQAGYKTKRVDELVGQFNISRKIIEYIFRSDAIVAEITDKNSNVFYEMGVAHAIGNKTIMIAQDADKLPFDIRNYRCIIYEQSVEGLQRLQEEIGRSLQEIGDWSRHPSNPVQDFMPHDAFVLQSDFERLQKALQQKDELLRAAQMESAAFKKQLREKDERLKQAAPKAELEKLQKEMAEKQVEISTLQKELLRLRQPAAPKSAPPPSLKKLLRSQPLTELSVEAAKKMLQEKNFFDSDYNKSGKGLPHQYEALEQHGEKLVRDHATGLTWQQSGSSDSVTYADAEKYVLDLNAKKFAGFNDWRLPTLEEAMSLMEPKENASGMHIDPKFDSTNSWFIWTSDTYSAGEAWVANFSDGYCDPLGVDGYYRVRAVR